VRALSKSVPTELPCSAKMRERRVEVKLQASRSPRHARREIPKLITMNSTHPQHHLEETNWDPHQKVMQINPNEQVLWCTWLGDPLTSHQSHCHFGNWAIKTLSSLLAPGALLLTVSNSLLTPCLPIFNTFWHRKDNLATSARPSTLIPLRKYPGQRFKSENSLESTTDSRLPRAPLSRSSP
jgi:hypothetical protein